MLLAMAALSGRLLILPVYGKGYVRTQEQLSGSVFTSPSMAQTSVLEVGKSIERILKGGETHAYIVMLPAGQLLHVVFEQKGVNLAYNFSGQTESRW